jgi:hypothetical protein
MWENRDTFFDLPELVIPNPADLYFLSVVVMNINPYYWKEEIHNYSKNLTYERNQVYYSP